MDEGNRRDAALRGISARDVLDAAPGALVIVGDDGAIVDANTEAARIFGYERGELPGRPIEMLVPERHRAALADDRHAFRRDPRRRPVNAGAGLSGLRKDGTEFRVEMALSPLDSAGGTLVLASIHDVSPRQPAEAARKDLLRQRLLHTHISHLAHHDPLTGLPNRALLHDRIAAATSSASGDGRHPAVVFLDLDRFKQVNDSLGHGVGDWLLESVAARLTAAVGEDDTVSRQGGDEFLVLLHQVRSRDEAASAAARILGALTGTHRFGMHELHVTASAGIAVYPDDGTDSETLIKNADIAMFNAKEQGRGRFQFFSDEMNARVVERQALEGGLRGALERGEFELYYQPKIDLETGQTIGAEALLRWRHPDRGLIPPERFVPLAEDSGLIVPIGQWVLGEACGQARAWQEAGFGPVPVAVNVCAIELRHPGFLDGVRRILDETGLDPRLLEVELTESVLMESAGTAAAVLRELKAMGIRLAIDDFGTGYSSLSYLAQFPIDALKVDQSFVRKITSGTEGSPIITAVINMGKSLNRRVIAEGVETPAQLAFLQSQRCEEGQGFHFSRPLRADQFRELLRASARAR